MQRRPIYILVIAVLLLGFAGTSVHHADDSDVGHPQPVGGGGLGKSKVPTVEVDGEGKPGPTPVFKDTEIPSGAQAITGKTSKKDLPHLGGEVNPVIRNDTRKDATDLHVHVSAKDENGNSLPVRVGGISVTGGDYPWPESVGVPGNGPGVGVQVPENQAGRIAKGKTTYPPDPPNGGTVTVNVVVEVWDSANSTWKRYEDKPVTTHIWWTHGHNRDKVIVQALPNGLGDGDDRVALLSVFPNFDPSPVEIGPEEGGAVSLNHIALGEADRHRFQSGSVVIRPRLGSFKLTEGSEILIFDEEGDDVSSERFSVSNLRVDADGNLVFDIAREQTDELHVAFVVVGVQLHDLPSFDAGGNRTITAGLGGAVLGGLQFDNVWTLAIVEEE
jgi:hypothetical protein